MTKYARISGSGIFLPETIVGNREIEKDLGLDSGWIERRTGIKERRYALDRKIEDLYVEASLSAVRSCNPKTIDTIVVCWDVQSESRGLPVPAIIHKALKTETDAREVDYIEGFHYCTGFLKGLDYARLRIEGGRSEGALVVAASKLSDYFHQNQKETSVLWGDGAGALVLEPSDTSEFIGYAYHSEMDEYFKYTTEKNGKISIQMNGQKIYRLVVNQVPRNIRKLFDNSDCRIEDTKLFLLHQANGRMLRRIQEELGLKDEQMFLNLPHYGNMGVASLPVLYHETRDMLKKGDLYVLCGFGRGISVNSLLLRK